MIRSNKLRIGNYKEGREHRKSVLELNENNNTRKLKDAVYKISHDSVLLMSDAVEILTDCMVHPDILDVVTEKIIECGNKFYDISIIKVEVHSIVIQFSLCRYDRKLFDEVKELSMSNRSRNVER